MKIAITGASGHIGNNLCRALLKKGYSIKVLINQTEKAVEGLDVEKINGNVLDPEKIDLLVKDCNYVFHAAAIISIGNEPKHLVFEVNTKGTKNIVDACIKHNVKRLIHFSSIHAFHHDSADLVLNEQNPQANFNDHVYDKSKASGEAIVLEACNKGLDAIILNPSSVVGPYDFKPSLVGQMLVKAANGTMPFIIKGGYHFVDVRDIVEAAINAMSMGTSKQRYLLTSEWKSLLEVSRIFCEKSNRKAPNLIPTFLAWIGLPFISVYSRIVNAKPLYTSESLKIIANSPKNVENKKAIEELNFKPRPITETFTDAYEWFLQNNFIRKP